MYISEIAPLNLRGGLGTVNQLAVTVGLLLSQVLGIEPILGTNDGWPILLGLAICPAVLQLLLLPICPESPRYLLITKQWEEEARKGGFLETPLYPKISISLILLLFCSTSSLASLEQCGGGHRGDARRRTCSTVGEPYIDNGANLLANSEGATYHRHRDAAEPAAERHQCRLLLLHDAVHELRLDGGERQVRDNWHRVHHGEWSSANCYNPLYQL